MPVREGFETKKREATIGSISEAYDVRRMVSSSVDVEEEGAYH